MKILHSGTLDVNAGGPAMSTYYTLYGLQQQGIDAEIIMFPLSPNGKLKGTEVPVHYTDPPIIPKSKKEAIPHHSKRNALSTRYSKVKQNIQKTFFKITTTQNIKQSRLYTSDMQR